MGLPDPRTILGGLDIVGDGQEDAAEDATPCLRDTKAHKTFLFLFAKTVMLADTFKKNSTVKLLSEYMGIALEAFAVLTYANNYHSWLEEATRSNGGGAGGAVEVSDFTDPSTSNGHLKRWTTRCSRGGDGGGCITMFEGYKCT